ncbi:hypothetical protein EXIGLDRAFT_617314 [Exidia glandulosa HHB12029]|uniref:Peroxisomal membrane protein PEX13 n=1 Tax=Exidia glandulosa HHB12029 TaxID=1314781 RepID=A0A165G983_EXIGL|nr:hypothetical protein EXIGLDRAFT_617314 [Exidia glandulosa HHB12029]
MTTTNSSDPPAIPPRPTALGAANTAAAAPYTSPYSNYNSYSSPYSRGGGGYGGMYGGAPGLGMPYGPEGVPSLTQQMEGATGQTFALLQAIVQTFGGFAQMLESTFMATHSSFFAMVGVADQLGQLRNALGTVLGLFGLVAWLRRRLFGPNAQDELRREFRAFAATGAGGAPPVPRPSRKPLIVFLLAVLGIPYAMHRLIRVLAARIPPPGAGVPTDPSQLAFVRAIHAFPARDALELTLQPGDIVAVLGPLEGEWWRGRTRDGREGFFPAAYVEVIRQPGAGAVPQLQEAAPAPAPQAEPKKVD